MWVGSVLLVLAGWGAALRGQEEEAVLELDSVVGAWVAVGYGDEGEALRGFGLHLVVVVEVDELHLDVPDWAWFGGDGCGRRRRPGDLHELGLAFEQEVRRHDDRALARRVGGNPLLVGDLRLEIGGATGGEGEGGGQQDEHENGCATG